MEQETPLRWGNASLSSIHCWSPTVSDAVDSRGKTCWGAQGSLKQCSSSSQSFTWRTTASLSPLVSCLQEHLVLLTGSHWLQLLLLELLAAHLCALADKTCVSWTELNCAHPEALTFRSLHALLNCLGLLFHPFTLPHTQAIGVLGNVLDSGSPPRCERLDKLSLTHPRKDRTLAANWFWARILVLLWRTLAKALS